MVKQLATALVLANASLIAAHADPISGLISVGGSAAYNSSSITFKGLGSVFGTSSGTLQTLALCDACVTYPINPFVYGSNFVSGLPIFDVVDNGIEVILDVSGIDPGSGVDGFGDLLVRGTGVLSETGYTSTAATFALSSQFGSDGASVSFSNSAAATAVTPEPASLALLCTGMAAGAILLRRRIQISSKRLKAVPF